ncbi:Helicase associated domain protein [Streptomyces sp. NPDC093510]|uniref:DEAD/DEAH box helicase n=1 Tax=Streptomyces sp. NPDC093510 TaxID=3155199 RepID=UPI003434E880
MPPLWPHQEQAIQAVLETFATQSRATVVMACGTGKTRVGGALLDDAFDNGRALLVAPSINLLAQTLHSWHETYGQALGQVAAVCSDPHLMERTRRELHADVAASVTTEAAELAELLAGVPRATVAATYHSLPAVARAHRDHGLARWGSIVVDEAHRSAGRTSKTWTWVHDDVLIPGDRRLYLTATPKILTRNRTGETDILGMDDEKTFGPTVFRLGYARALELKLVADYRVVVAIVTDEEVQQLVEEQPTRTTYLGVGASAVSASMLARQIAVLRAARQFNVRNMLTFHHRVRDAAWFAQALPQVDQLLGPDPAAGGPLQVACAHAGQSSSRRDAALSLLNAPSTAAGRRIVCQVRMFGEGIDAPRLDGAAFVDVRNSDTDNVQAIGRIVRRDGPKVATIIVPILLGPDEDPQSALASSAYAPLWRVLEALRANDERLAAELDSRRREAGRASQGVSASRGQAPDWLHVTGKAVPAGFIAAIHAQAVRSTTPNWEEFFGAAESYRKQHGDLLIPQSYKTPPPAELALGRWLHFQRGLAKDGLLLPDRKSRLEDLGMVWKPKDNQRDTEWEQFLTEARAHHAAHGDLLVPTSFCTPGTRFPLGMWLNRLRRGERTATAEQRTALDALGMDWHQEFGYDWLRGLKAARAYQKEHGDLLVPSDYTTDDDPPYALGLWISNWRKKKRQLGARQRGQLDGLGMIWDVYEHRWNQHLAAAKAFHEQHRHLKIPSTYVAPGPEKLRVGQWIVKQRQAALRGTLSPKRISALEAIGMLWKL